MIYRLLAIATAITWASPAAASNWYVVDFNVDDGNITFIDRDSIAQTGEGKLRALTYTVFNPMRGKAAAMEVEADVDCATRRRRFVHLRGFDADRVKFMDDATPGDWQETLPKSQGANFVDFICSRGATAKGDDLVGPTTPFEAGRDLLDKLRKKAADDTRNGA